MILVFVYWIAIKGIKDLSVPYTCMVFLVFLIPVKSLVESKKLSIYTIFKYIASDLLKPLLSMLFGFFACVLCLENDWKEAGGYAFDVAHTGIVVMYTAIITILIAIVNWLIIGLISKYVKYKKV